VPVKQLCDCYGMSPSTLRRWRRKAGDSAAWRQAMLDENRRLRRRLRALQTEKAILQRILKAERGGAER